MKKLLYLLLLLPLGFFTSCTDDDDLPDVDVAVTISNVVNSNGYFYVVQGDTLKFDSITIKGNNDKTAVINAVTYKWGLSVVGWNPIAPYNFSFLTGATRDGLYNMELDFDIAQVDKTMAFAILDFPIRVVTDASQLPDGMAPQTYTLTYRMSPHSK